VNALNPPEDTSTTCPECGTDHSDSYQRLLENRIDALRAESEARAKELFRAAALLRDIRERMLLDYDGAPDSSSRWMGHYLARIDEAVS
jgi:hypothetical protein